MDKNGIKENCQVLTYTVLPQAIRIYDGVWAVATKNQIDLSRVWERTPTKRIKIQLPLSLTDLPLGYSAFGVSIYLPTYYQGEEKYGEKDNLWGWLKRVWVIGQGCGSPW